MRKCLGSSGIACTGAYPRKNKTDRTAQSWGLSECGVYLCSEREWCSVRGGSTVAPLASTTHTKPQVLESGWSRHPYIIVDSVYIYTVIITYM